MTPNAMVIRRQTSLHRRLLGHRLWAPLNDARSWDRLLASVNPLWSMSECRARVVRVVEEASGLSSLWLRPNRHFKGFRPGQHALLELEIDGVRHGRCFSFSQAPRADGLLRLTIKAKPDGIVSTAAQRLQPGQIVRLSQAQGEFAPSAQAGKLLFLSAGSGVTPMLALLQAERARCPVRDIVVIQCGRTRADTLFAGELGELCGELPNSRLWLHASAESGRLDSAALAARVPDWQERQTLLCGPDGFMRAIETMFADAGCAGQLRSESFGRRVQPIDPLAPEHTVSYGFPEQVFTVRAGESLLDGAEQAGLQPRSGCRRGICHSCQCRKRSGSVRNLLTGQLSGPGEELIQLCISTPLSALVLDAQNARTPA